MDQPKVPSGDDYTGKLDCYSCGQFEGERVKGSTVTGKVVMSAILPVCDGCANVPDPSTAGYAYFVEGMRDGWFGRGFTYTVAGISYALGYQRGEAMRLRLMRINAAKN
jgi:hypothetical protein